MDTLLQELIAFLKGASPVVWEALYRQVYVNAGAFIAWAIGLAALCAAFFRVGKFSWSEYKKDEYSMYDAGSVFVYIASACLGFAAFALLVNAAMQFANPEYYAIRYILKSLGQ